MSCALLDTVVVNGVRVESVTLRVKNITSNTEFDDFLQVLRLMYLKPGQFVVVYNVLGTSLPGRAHVAKLVAFLREIEPLIEKDLHHVVVVVPRGVTKVFLQTTIAVATAFRPAICPIKVVDAGEYCKHKKKAYPWCAA